MKKFFAVIFLLSNSVCANDLSLLQMCINNDVQGVRHALAAGAHPNCLLLPFKTLEEALQYDDFPDRLQVVDKLFVRLHSIYELREASVLRRLMHDALTLQTFQLLCRATRGLTPLVCGYILGVDSEILQALFAAGALPIIRRETQQSKFVDIRFVSDPDSVAVVLDAIRNLTPVQRRIAGILFPDDEPVSPEWQDCRFSWRPERFIFGDPNILAPRELLKSALFFNEADALGYAVGKRTLSAELLLRSGMIPRVQLDDLFRALLKRYLADEQSHSVLFDRLCMLVRVGGVLKIRDAEDGQTVSHAMTSAAFLNACDAYGQTLFHEAVPFSDERLLLMLLEMKGNPLIDDKDSSTVLQLAIRQHRAGVSFLKGCIERFKLDGNYRFSNGKTLFGEVVEAGDEANILFLLNTASAGVLLDSPYNVHQVNSPTCGERLKQKYGSHYFNFDEVSCVSEPIEQ